MPSDNPLEKMSTEELVWVLRESMHDGAHPEALPAEVRRRLERLDQLDEPIKGLLAGLPFEVPLGVCLQNLAKERDQLQARLAKVEAAVDGIY